ncbi:MAG: hypothetical protein RLZZ08_1261 [Pseudomonadota bacterium]|jgi:hypothetical protein
MRLRKLFIGLGALAALVLAFAWIDGGQQEMRLIEQPLDLPHGVVAALR